jgi:uncharacterized membrane protein YphA (DoxX/SURF4 family)
LPYVELALALLLVLGIGVRLTAIISGLMMLMFIGGIASVWARGLHIACGCFGGEGGTGQYLREILRDIGFLAMCGWMITFPRSRLALDPFPLPDEEPA